MLAQHVVERLGHQRLQAPALPPRQRVHRKGHFGAKEAGDLFAALAARWRCRLRRSRRGRRCDGSGRRRRRGGTAQVGEAGFAAHAAAFFGVDLRGVGKPTCRHVHM